MRKSILVELICRNGGVRDAKEYFDEVSRMGKNIFVKLIHRNGDVRDAEEYFGQVDTWKWRCQGWERIFWSSRHIEMELLRMQNNILVK